MNMLAVTSKRKKGFVILYAVLVAAVVAAIGIAVADLVARQIFLANVARQSQAAYYVADSGRGCLLYWNSRLYFGQVFDVGGGDPGFTSSKEIKEIGDAIEKCGNISGVITQDTQVNSRNFGIRFEDSWTNFCVSGNVQQGWDGNRLINSISVSGYNAKCDDIQACRRIVERTVVSD